MLYKFITWLAGTYLNQQGKTRAPFASRRLLFIEDARYNWLLLYGMN